jgi:hypothetical protein
MTHECLISPQDLRLPERRFVTAMQELGYVKRLAPVLIEGDRHIPEQTL